jgi:hypothetical protein
MGRNRPLTDAERAKLRNQALVREEQKRQARDPSRSLLVKSGKIAGRLLAALAGGENQPVSVQTKLAAKKIRPAVPVIYRPDSTPNFAGTVAQPTYAVRAPNRPRNGSNLDALISQVTGDGAGFDFDSRFPRYKKG